MIHNVSELLYERAKEFPDKKAIVHSTMNWGTIHYKSYNFLELNNKINQFSHKLVELGVKPGHKVLFFVKPNLDFSAITFALFRIGAIPVFIDPGMKKSYFFKAISEVKPDVLIGIPIVHLMRRFFFKYFKNIKIFISTSSHNFLAKGLYQDLENKPLNIDIYQPSPTEMAAILYTSGGTGAPKGVVYTHNIFIEQTRMLKEEFKLTHEDTDIPGFPLFSFFTLAMGMTSVIPLMNPSKPSKANPKYLYKNIQDHKATFVAGSPAIWLNLAHYCTENKLTLPSVKYLVMFGAPVGEKLHLQFSSVLVNGTTYTPYGATECLPVANISGKYLLENTIEETKNGAGICVGRPFNGVEIKIIKSSEEIINTLDDCDELKSGDIGEIIVSSKNVTPGYYKKPEATKNAKIYQGNLVWHRMGDMGYLDDKGYLWFCGRKKHVISYSDKVFYPVMIEQVFNQNPNILKSALIKPKHKQKPILIVEKEKFIKSDQLKKDLYDIRSKYQLFDIVGEIYFQKNFPVDTRHNIKIDRTKMTYEFR